MKSPRSPAKQRGREFDRHSGTGTRGLPKKNGAGGKGVWGAEADQTPVAYLDKNDPNYDSDNDDAAPALPPSLALKPAAVDAAAPAASADSSAAASDDSGEANADTAAVVDAADAAKSVPPTPSPSATD